MFLQLSLLRSTTTTRVRFSAGQSPHSRLRLTPLFSLGGNRWKLTDLDSEIVQEKLCSWLSNAQTLIAEAAAPLVKPGQGKKMAIEHELEDIAMKEEVFMASGLTVERRTLNGYLSFASVVSIDRFGRNSCFLALLLQKSFTSLGVGRSSAGLNLSLYLHILLFLGIYYRTYSQQLRWLWLLPCC